ncbi:hypothetical protein Plhal304r1_c013g0050361 [Plasmopara halstedii]
MREMRCGGYPLKDLRGSTVFVKNMVPNRWRLFGTSQDFLATSGYFYHRLDEALIYMCDNYQPKFICW